MCPIYLEHKPQLVVLRDSQLRHPHPPPNELLPIYRGELQFEWITVFIKMSKERNSGGGTVDVLLTIKYLQ